MTSAAPMDYGLWLDTCPDGKVTLKGWTDTGAGRTDHWPPYTLCTRADLPARLSELGLVLAAGHDLTDLDEQWDVYVHHENPAQLRAHLDVAAA